VGRNKQRNLEGIKTTLDVLKEMDNKDFKDISVDLLIEKYSG